MLARHADDLVHACTEARLTMFCTPCPDVSYAEQNCRTEHIFSASTVGALRLLDSGAGSLVSLS